jgi:hypothetical protein
MEDMPPNTTVSTSATVFREEAGRARRFAAAMTDKTVIDRLNKIAAIYDGSQPDKILEILIASKSTAAPGPMFEGRLHGWLEIADGARRTIREGCTCERWYPPLFC